MSKKIPGPSWVDKWWRKTRLIQISGTVMDFDYAHDGCHPERPSHIKVETVSDPHAHALYIQINDITDYARIQWMLRQMFEMNRTDNPKFRDPTKPEWERFPDLKR